MADFASSQAAARFESIGGNRRWCCDTTWRTPFRPGHCPAPDRTGTLRRATSGGVSKVQGSFHGAYARGAVKGAALGGCWGLWIRSAFSGKSGRWIRWCDARSAGIELCPVCIGVVCESFWLRAQDAVTRVGGEGRTLHSAPRAPAGHDGRGPARDEIWVTGSWRSHANQEADRFSSFGNFRRWTRSGPRGGSADNGGWILAVHPHRPSTSLT